MSPEIESAITAATGIAKLGFYPLVVLIFIGGYFQKWVWGHQLVKSEAREAKANERADFWQALYLQKVTALDQKVEELTRRLLERTHP